MLNMGSTAREASGSIAATAQPRPISQTSQMISGSTAAANGPGSVDRKQSPLEPMELPAPPPRRIFPGHGWGAQPGQTVQDACGSSAAKAMVPTIHTATSTICGCTSLSQDAPHAKRYPPSPLPSPPLRETINPWPSSSHPSTKSRSPSTPHPPPPASAATAVAEPPTAGRPASSYATAPHDPAKPPVKRQIVCFSFYKVMPEWRRLPAERKGRAQGRIRRRPRPLEQARRVPLAHLLHHRHARRCGHVRLVHRLRRGRAEPDAQRAAAHAAGRLPQLAAQLPGHDQALAVPDRPRPTRARARAAAPSARAGRSTSSSTPSGRRAPGTCSPCPSASA